MAFVHVQASDDSESAEDEEEHHDEEPEEHVPPPARSTSEIANGRDARYCLSVDFHVQGGGVDKPLPI